MGRELEEGNAKFTILGHLITGLCALLFLVAAGLCIVLLFRSMYYFDISHLNIVEMSGYAREEIVLNYNALINWCMPWVNAEFALPTFPSSTNAIIHFEEVKAIKPKRAKLPTNLKGTGTNRRVILSLFIIILSDL